VNETVTHSSVSYIKNEVLCFVSNKINIMPYELICKLCTDFYSDSDLEAAKDLLFETAFSALDENRPRNIKRRGAGKKQNIVQDILNVFLEMNPQSVPCYVAQDLSNLPPLSMDTFDMSRILRDIETLKLKMQILQEAQEVSLTANLALANNELSSAVLTTGSQDPPTESNSPESNQSAIEQVEAITTSALEPTAQHSNNHLDNGGPSIQAVEEPNNEEPESDDHDLLRLAEIQELHSETTVPKARVQGNSQHAGNPRQKTNKPSYAQAARRKQKPPQRTESLQSTTSASAHSQRRFITGKGKHFSLRAKTKGAETRANQGQRICTGIFVSRLTTNTKSQDVIDHLENEIGVRCRCEPLKTKFNSYKSFCIRLPRSMHHRLLNPTVWPVGTLVREYCENQ